MRVSSRTLLALAVLGTAPSLLSAQGFGGAIAVAGQDVLVSEPSHLWRSGIVYVFRKGRTPTAPWAERAQISPPDGRPQDNFGVTLAADGDVALIGQVMQSGGPPSANAPAPPSAVYVYTRSRAGDWTQTAKIDRPDSANGFGTSIAIAGELALIGAPGRDSLTGVVYVYRRTGTSWGSAGTVTASDARRGDRFGASMGVTGNQVIIGAPGRGRNVGLAYLFSMDSGALREVARLVPSDTTQNLRSGTSVAVAGDHAFVGAPGTDRAAGAVFQFHRDSTGRWSEQMVLRAFDRSNNAQFGASLVMDNGELWIGSPFADQFEGRIYRLKRGTTGTSWADMTKLGIAGLERGAGFGRTMTVAGGIAVVGVPGDEQGAGSARVFERAAAGTFTDRGRIVSAQVSLPAITAGRRNCESGTAATFGCRDVDLLSFLPISAIGGTRGTRLSGSWGWTDPQTNREYALIGRTDATAFVDVTNPENPVYVGDLPRTEGARPTSWREIKVYRNYALIVSDGSGAHGVQFFDLTQLRGARSAPVHFTPTVTYREVASVHDIVVNEESGFAYAVGSNGGGQSCGGGLHAINIQDPTQPRFAGCFADVGTGRSGGGYTHDAQCVMYRGPDVEHRGKEICLASNETVISIQDVTDKAHPRVLSRGSYPNVGYTHQGWLTEDQRYFYVNDELDEVSRTVSRTRTLVWDLNDLDDPVLVKEYFGPTSASDHNLYVVGNRLYQSNYNAGLRVLDISNPVEPREIGYLDTNPWFEDRPGFSGSWNNYPFFRSGNVVVSSISEGIFVARYNATRPVP